MTPAQAQKKISWQQLSDVEYVRGETGVFKPDFPEEVAALEGKEVRLKGFMMPLEQGEKQRQFILSSYPVADCQFCLPGGPGSFIEVRAPEGVPFSYKAIAVRGTLELLEDDQLGMLYRLTDARR